MYRVAILGLPLLISACGGSESADSTPFPFTGVDRFTLSPYTQAAAALEEDGIVGQWVVITENATVRSDFVNAELPERGDTTTLRTFLIRQPDPEVKEYEVSDCEGGFFSLEAKNGTLTSDAFVAYQDGDNRYKFEVSGSRYVPLSPVAGFTETYDYTARYRRVSDRTDGMGSITRNWSDTDGDTTQTLTCFAVERAANDFHSILLAGDSEGVVYMTSNSVPPVPDAIFTTEDPERSIMNFFGLGEQGFSFSENNDERASLTFYADDNDGLSVSGSAEVAIIPPAEIAITPPAVAER